MDGRKVFMDPIHELIELHPLLVKIIDTPEFQRMRNIKQLGMCYYVYPGASHNRFEHSIGVCHLAGRFVRKLRTTLDEEKKLPDDDENKLDDDGEKKLSDDDEKKSPVDGEKKLPDDDKKKEDDEKNIHADDGKLHDKKKQDESLKITPEEELCVEIAGLCHDLGHGPFSHTFDKTLIPEIMKEKEKKHGEIKNKKFAIHEERSVAVLRHLIEKNQLMPEFEKFGIDKKCIEFIGELITASEKKPPGFKRKPKENFLYEIVSNKNNGIDVDKWDYFARDCHMLGIKNDFDHNRCIQFAKVKIDKDGWTHICYRDKEVLNLYEMYHTRFKLHVRACHHKVTHILDHEVAKVLWGVRNDFKINGKSLNNIILALLSDSGGDMTEFCLLTDDILSQILRMPDEGAFTDAKKSIRAIYSRKFPKLIGQTFSLKEELELGTDKELKEELLEELPEGIKIEPEDVVVLTMELDYGKKKKNPIDSVKFYTKENPNEVVTKKREQVSLLLPTAFSEKKVRVYCRDGMDETQREALKDRFKEWRITKEAPLPEAEGTK